MDDLVPRTPQDPPIYWCRTAEESYAVSPTDYEPMLWPGLTDPKEFTAWSNLLEFAGTIGFSHDESLWGFVVEKVAGRGKQVARVDPKVAVARDSTTPRIGERSSTRVRAAAKAQNERQAPLPHPIRVGRGGKGVVGSVAKVGQGRAAQGSGVMAGRGGERARLAIVKRKRGAHEDWEEKMDTSEEGEGGEADGHMGDSEDGEGDDDDSEGKDVVATDGDGDLALMGVDDDESMGGEHDSDANTSVNAGNGDGMELVTVDDGGGLAPGKRRATGQLVPEPSRGKQARTSNNPSSSVNTSAPFPSASASIQAPPSNPQLETMVCSCHLVPGLSQSNSASN